MFPLLPDYLLPLAIVITLGLAFPARHEPGRLATRLLLAGLIFLVLRYFWWRLTQTLVPPTGLTLQVIGIWLVFVIELASWFDAGILFAQLSRRTDRTPEADRHEARLRAMDPCDLPHVDILIATYNEPIEVLERTIIGAISLDWPADRLHVHVLDDSRRDWLRDYCRDKGIAYLTRADNTHAKAGNINAALKRTQSEFFLILDADFIPQRKMLYRMIGFFEDPTVGIVQVPHEFFNFDPLQTNLAMRASLPSDQKMFFHEIMRGRDGWNCAFCCGSNSLTRRAAMNQIGGAMPTGSITEDMLLTLAFLRQGYVTRYLCERLAVGLAPESLDAFFVQRSRWAQGALQILYLKEGPLGPGLRLSHRLMFLPTHWLTQSLMQVMALLLPVAYLLFGFVPMILNDISDLLYFQFPALFASIMVLRRLAPDAYFAIPSTVLAALQSFRFLPMLLKTLVKPHGHKFKVTPKGSDASGTSYDRFTLHLCLTLMWGTTAGFALAMWAGTIGDGARQLFPIVSFWSIVNGLILAGVLTVAFSRRAPRAEERFFLRTKARIASPGAAPEIAQTLDVSMSGARISGPDLTPGAWVALQLPEVLPILAFVRWSRNGITGIQFLHQDQVARDQLIACIYTACDETIQTENIHTNVLLGFVHSVFAKPPGIRVAQAQEPLSADADTLAWFADQGAGPDGARDWYLDAMTDRADHGTAQHSA